MFVIMSDVKIGIIGGSGLEKSNILDNPVKKIVETKYGKPSDELLCGSIGGVEVVIIPRHGRKHTIPPSSVPFRANVEALSVEGCTHVLAATACGSLRESIKPGDLVILDQFIDRTTKRIQSFYEEPYVCHIPMGYPFCPEMRDVLEDVAQTMDVCVHSAGTVVTIEGPRFSTKAESKMFQQWGGDVINMTTCPEAVLVREKGMHYASVAMCTDYDCWRSDEEDHVNINMVLECMKQNAIHTTELLIKAVPLFSYQKCQCADHIKTSIMGGE